MFIKTGNIKFFIMWLEKMNFNIVKIWQYRKNISKMNIKNNVTSVKKEKHIITI